MIGFGFVVALGLLFLLAKLPWRWKITLTSYPVTVDVLVFSFLTILHWGTFSGVMVATIGAMFCSITLSVARRVIGYVKNGRYIRGMFDVSHKLGA